MKKCILALVVMSAGIGVPAVHGDNFTFTGSSGDWSDPTNWASGLVPVNAPATTVTMVGPTTNPPYTATVDASRPLWQINGLLLQHNSNSQTPDQLLIDPATQLEFEGPGAFITETKSVAETISGPMIFASNVTITTSTPTMTLIGPISGAGGMTIIQQDFFLGGNNTFAGGVTVMPGPGVVNTKFNLLQPTALGTGPLTLENSTTPGSGMALLVTPVAGENTTINNTIIVNEPAPNLTAGEAIDGAAAGNYTVTQIITNAGANTTIGEGFSVTGVSWDVGTLTLNGTGELDVTVPLTLETVTEMTPSRLALGPALGTVHITHASTYTGGTITNVPLYADAPHSLGSGPVQVLSSSGALHLEATDAASNSVTATENSIFYDANGAAGGHSLFVSGTGGAIILSNAISSFAGSAGSDTFNIGAGATIEGNDATLALLDRAIGSGGSPNFFASAGARVQDTTGGFPTIHNLGTNADLIVILNTALTTPLQLGTGTPWEGVGGNVSGQLIANSDITLDGGGFGISGTNNSFSIVPGLKSVSVHITSASGFVSSLSDYSGVSQFVLSSLLALDVPNALGGGNGTSAVPVDVLAGGVLSVRTAAAVNGNVTMEAGSELQIGTAGLTGAGIISRSLEPMTITVTDPNGFTGSQLATSFVQPGDTVNVEATNVAGLASLNPAANYNLMFSSLPFAPSEGFKLNGGSIFLTPFTQELFLPTTGGGTIHVGASGATLASNGIFLPQSSVRNAVIDVPIIAAGIVNFGYPNANTVNDTTGGILLANTSNSFARVNVNGIVLAAISPAALAGADVHLNGGELAIESGSASPTPVTYLNAITIESSGMIADNFSNNTANEHPLPQSTAPLILTTINLNASTLSFQLNNPMTVTNLNLNSDAAIVSPGQGTITLQTVTDNGTNHALSFAKSVSVTTNSLGFTVAGPLNITGPISVTQGLVLFNGTVEASSQPLTVGTAGGIGGAGIIHRPVLFVDGVAERLAPGTGTQISFGPFTSAPGTLAVDSLALSSLTTLSYNLGTPNVPGGPTNDLVFDNGNLTLAGTLALITGTGFGPGTYTLITYVGTLTNDGLTLPAPFSGDGFALDLSTPGQVNLIVTAVPEPTTLAILSLATLLLTPRRRRH